MTFETLDYLAEAHRIKAAFDVKGDCEFFELDDDSMSLRQDGFVYIELNHPDSLQLSCLYEREDGRTYCIHSWVESSTLVSTRITILWNDCLQCESLFDVGNFAHGFVLAKGLFHLGLLSPEAETDLRVSISAHQKMEWTVEFQQRVGHE